MATIVLKFGGTSLATPRRVRAAAEQVARRVQGGDRVAVVVSAMGSTTDRLIGLARQVHPDPPGRELDALLANGERISAALLAMALQRLGVEAASLDAVQAGIACEALPGRARIRSIDRARIERHLEAGRVPVVTGFQGVDAFGDLNTLGRGGSDTTAVALAAALEVGRDGGWCEILTDVDGIHTADPRLVPGARCLASISAETMLALARRGAVVMHPPAAALALHSGVRVLVRHAHRRRGGTWIEPHRADAAANHGPVAAAIRRNLVEIGWDEPVPADDIDQCSGAVIEALRVACPSLEALAASEPAMESRQTRRWSVVVSAGEEASAWELIRARLAHGGTLERRDGCSLVSVVGTGSNAPGTSRFESSDAGLASLSRAIPPACEVLAWGATPEALWWLVGRGGVEALRAIHKACFEEACFEETCFETPAEAGVGRAAADQGMPAAW